jgi:hypothetical protein
MPSKKYWEKFISIETPATYRIRVKGNLDDTWSERLAGMDIMSKSTEDNESISTLVGTLVDQAELVGVLNNLYELHLPLLTVEVLEGDRRKEGEHVVQKYDLERDK